MAKIKKPRKKKYPIRGILLELKRVRWPSREYASKSYLKVLIFVAIFVAIFFLITFTATYIWSQLGVGFSTDIK